MVHLSMEPGAAGVLAVAVAPLRIGLVVEEIVDTIGQAHDFFFPADDGIRDGERRFWLAEKHVEKAHDAPLHVEWIDDPSIAETSSRSIALVVSLRDC